MNRNSNITRRYSKYGERLQPLFDQSHPPPPQEVNNLTKSQSTLDLENMLAELSSHDHQMSTPAATTHVHVGNPNFDEKVLRKQLELACAAAPMRLSPACLVKSHRDIAWQSRSSSSTTVADDTDDDVEFIENMDAVVKVKKPQRSTASAQLNSTNTGFIEQPVYGNSTVQGQSNSRGQYSPIQSNSAGSFPFIHNPVCVNPNCHGQCNNFFI